MILQLRDEGLLDLDTTLAEFVPGYPLADQITVEQLLRHRSGIPEIQLVDGFFILSILLNPGHWRTPLEILDWTTLPIPMLDLGSGELVPREPLTHPGGNYHYSQPGYVALGYIIESVTGQALADVYDERIIQPLGMTRTSFPRPDDPLEPVGYTNVFGLPPGEGARVDGSSTPPTG